MLDQVINSRDSDGRRNGPGPHDDGGSLRRLPHGRIRDLRRDGDRTRDPRRDGRGGRSGR